MLKPLVIHEFRGKSYVDHVEVAFDYIKVEQLEL